MYKFFIIIVGMFIVQLSHATTLTITKSDPVVAPFQISFTLNTAQIIYWTADIPSIEKGGFKNKLYLLPANDSQCEMPINPPLSTDLKAGFNNGWLEFPAGTYILDIRCAFVPYGVYSIIFEEVGEIEIAPHPLTIGPINMGTSTSEAISITNTGPIPVKINTHDVLISTVDPGFDVTSSYVNKYVYLPPERSLEVVFSPPITMELEANYSASIQVFGEDIFGNQVTDVTAVVGMAKFPTLLLILIFILGLILPVLMIIYKKIMATK